MHVNPFGGNTLAGIEDRFMYEEVLTEQTLQIVSVSEVDTICVYSKVQPGEGFMSPLPNIFNIC